MWGSQNIRTNLTQFFSDRTKKPRTKRGFKILNQSNQVPLSSSRGSELLRFVLHSLPRLCERYQQLPTSLHHCGD